MNKHDELLEKRREYENDLAGQVNELSGKAGEYGKTALMVAGGIFVAYQVFKLVSRSTKSKSRVYRQTEESESEVEDAERIVIRKDNRAPGVIDMFKAEMSSFLVELAKEKVLDFIRQLERSKFDAPEKEDYTQ